MVPSAMVALNRAAAVGMARGPRAGLAAFDGVDGLDDHHLLHATRAELLRRLGRDTDAAGAYARALALPRDDGAQAEDLRRRLAGLGGKAPDPAGMSIRAPAGARAPERPS